MSTLHEITGLPFTARGRYGVPFAESRRGAFLAGRAYRTFKELNIPGAGTYTVQIVVPVNTILTGLETLIDAGILKVETAVGGTPGGTFSEAWPLLSQNNQSDRPVVAPTVTFMAGGTHTGGTLIDVIRVKADSNTGRATSVGGVASDERGVSPGTYYFRFTNLHATDAVTGTFKLRWEERPLP